MMRKDSLNITTNAHYLDMSTLESITMNYFGKLFIALIITHCTVQLAVAAECSAKSGATRVSLLELYTSEGCSSCPPADKWLSNLKPDAQAFIPLAFHVDYWNDIGWVDRFSKAEYSERQRRSAKFSGAHFIYTPQFVINGHDFKGINESRLNLAIAANRKLSPRANLSLETITQTGGETSLKAKAQAVHFTDIKNVDIFVVIYENQLSSKVNSGENTGRLLKHDYVVRHLFGAYPLSSNNEFFKNISLKPEWKVRDAGAVIFAQDSQNGEILQSLQLPFCS